MWQIIVPAVIIGVILSSNKKKPKKKCSVCSDESTEYKCTCGSLFCKDCTDTCSTCDTVLCADCLVTCSHCGEDFCGKCVESIKNGNFSYLEDLPIMGYHCQGCWDLMVKPLLEKYEDAKMAAWEVTCYSKNYRGHIRVNPASQQEIETNWFKDKDEAEYSLKVIAAYQGYNLVHNLSFDVKNSYDGNYTYRMWSATGIAGHIL